MTGLPLVDVSPLLEPGANDARCAAVGRAIDAACRDTGFLLVTGHGVDRGLRDDLERLSREFFALPDVTKAEIAMARGGVAWRGWFPVGGELTSGRPDVKEGVYFGTELPPGDPSWDATVTPLPQRVFDDVPVDDRSRRWDRQSVHAWHGVYGDYLTAKVAKVFPELAAALR